MRLLALILVLLCLVGCADRALDGRYYTERDDDAYRARRCCDRRCR